MWAKGMSRVLVIGDHDPALRFFETVPNFHEIIGRRKIQDSQMRRFKGMAG
jgi:hypothetical protein